MLAPSNATLCRVWFSRFVCKTAPSAGLTSIMYGPEVSHKSTPSKATPDPSHPTVKVPKSFPSLARNLVTVPPSFGTQMFAPSKARASRPPVVTLKVPAGFPSSLNRLTVPSKFVTYIWVPSQMMSIGPP